MTNKSLEQPRPSERQKFEVNPSAGQFHALPMSAIRCRPSSSSFRRSSRVKGTSQPPLIVQVPRKIPEHTRVSLLSHTRTRIPRHVPQDSSLSLAHQQSQPGPPTSMAEIVLWDSKLGREILSFEILLGPQPSPFQPLTLSPLLTSLCLRLPDCDFYRHCYCHYLSQFGFPSP